jgi:sec-independent protein translocase protein TatC
MSEEKEMNFLDHLEELRWHIMRSLTVIIVIMIVAFIFTKWIFTNIVFAPAQPDFITFRWVCELSHWMGLSDALCVEVIPMKIQSRFMTGQFTMQITASFVIGLVLGFPYLIWEMWKFIRPGLHKKEQKNSTGAVWVISSLFLLGVMFGYFIISPMTIYFLSTYQISDMIQNEFDITSYVSTVVSLVFGSGALFQLPVVIYFLTRIGLVTPQFLRKYRKHSIVIILVVAAVVTPPDPFSQTIIAIPLYLLFEFSIFISSRVYKRKLREEAEEELNSAKA